MDVFGEADLPEVRMPDIHILTVPNLMGHRHTLPFPAPLNCLCLVGVSGMVSMVGMVGILEGEPSDQFMTPIKTNLFPLQLHNGIPTIVLI